MIVASSGPSVPYAGLGRAVGVKVKVNHCLWNAYCSFVSILLLTYSFTLTLYLGQVDTIAYNSISQTLQHQVIN